MAKRQYPPTHGPWVFKYGMVYKETEQGDIPLLMAHREPGNGTRPVERDSNCQLAATAPQLLDALTQLVSAIDGLGLAGRFVDALGYARTIIDKATSD